MKINWKIRCKSSRAEQQFTQMQEDHRKIFKKKKQERKDSTSFLRVKCVRSEKKVREKIELCSWTEKKKSQQSVRVPLWWLKKVEGSVGVKANNVDRSCCRCSPGRRCVGVNTRSALGSGVRPLSLDFTHLIPLFKRTEKKTALTEKTIGRRNGEQVFLSKVKTLNTTKWTKCSNGPCLPWQLAHSICCHLFLSPRRWEMSKHTRMELDRCHATGD